MAGVDEFGGGHGRIDATAEGDEHLHAARPARNLPTESTTAVVASATSAAVVVRPSVRRSAPRARSFGTPMAAKTCDGSMAPLAHAEAALAHTPASSSRYNS